MVSAQLDLAAVNFLKRQNKRAAILRLIRDVRTGLTVAEITKALRISHASVSARVHDAERRNEIRKSGKRATDSGRLAWCWVPVEAESADVAQLQTVGPVEFAEFMDGGP